MSGANSGATITYLSHGIFFFLKANETYAALHHTSVCSEHLDPSICRYKKAFRPVEALTAIVRRMLIRTVSVPARRTILVNPLTIYRGHFLNSSVALPIASMLGLPT